MSSDSRTPTINQGGIGTIHESDSNYTVTKRNKIDRSFNRVSESINPVSCNLLKQYLLLEFPFLVEFQRDEAFIIPANVLSTEQIEDMLNLIASYALFRMGPSEGEVLTAIDYGILRNPDLNEITRDVGVVYSRKEIAIDLKTALITLREFLVAEYFASMDVVDAEAIIHNKGFAIWKDEEGKFEVAIDMENWSGTEARTEPGMEYGQMVDFKQENLKAVITNIEKLESPEEKGRRIYETLLALKPVARMLDFMVSNSRTRLVSRNGETEVETIGKLSICHFDVKPENIFSRNLADFNTGNPTANLILGDFGLSQIAEAPHGMYTGGTAAYKAPELIDEYFSKMFTRADVYSFAVTLYYLLLGHRPETFIDPKNGQKTRDKAFTFVTVSDDGRGIIEAETNLVIELDLHNILIERGIASQDSTDTILHILSHGMSLIAENRYSSCSELIEDLLAEVVRYNVV